MIRINIFLILLYIIINVIYGINTFTYNELANDINNNNNSKSIINELYNSIRNKELWSSIPLPKDSLFRGMSVPNDTIKWNKAKQMASKGSLVLLRKIRKVLNYPHDLIQLDKPVRWAHKMADFLIDKDTKWNPNSFISKYQEVDRSVIVLAGHKKFKDDNFEGDEVVSNIKEYSPRDMIDDMKLINSDPLVAIPVPIIILGFPEENTCWVGTYFLNRTLGNVFNDGTMGGPLRKEKNEIYKLLDHPNILAVITHQHHNLSHHPKVLSLPCGVDDPKSLWDTLNSVYNKISTPSRRKELLMEYKKQHLLFTASSSWGPRPFIIDCVKGKLGNSFFILREKVDLTKYYNHLIKSFAVLAVPGLVIF